MEQDPPGSDDRGPDSGPGSGPDNGPDNGTDDGPMSVPDKDLPEDLQPAEDNPLAQPAGDEVPDDVITDGGGGHREPSGSSEGPEDASSPGEGDAAGGPTSPDEASSGTRSEG
jgi:hypothetical protein